MCPPSPTHKPSAASHLSQGRAPFTPTAFSQKGQHPLFSIPVCPSWRACIQPLQHSGSVSCPTISVQTRSSSAMLQPQWEVPGTARSSKPAELHPCSLDLALGCSFCWLRGNFSPGHWGPHPAAPCLRCWAQKHSQHRPWLSSAQFSASAGCTLCVMVVQARPSSSCQDAWPSLGGIQLEQKPKALFSQEALQYSYYLPQISQNRWKFYNLLLSTSEKNKP